ncbi:hypothetical protein Tcan_17325 [Toxocara canis]|uniref:Uncharacterized protein n=1 Tax=Toxocara canis TaxID=6265 RepID=A0A0B2UPH4_TOXCA|nr:hypothetical protein Tcan_17325 [Toxocara canis]
MEKLPAASMEITMESMKSQLFKVFKGPIWSDISNTEALELEPEFGVQYLGTSPQFRFQTACLISSCPAADV